MTDSNRKRVFINGDHCFVSNGFRLGGGGYRTRHGLRIPISGIHSFPSGRGRVIRTFTFFELEFRICGRSNNFGGVWIRWFLGTLILIFGSLRFGGRRASFAGRHGFDGHWFVLGHAFRFSHYRL